MKIIVRRDREDRGWVYAREGTFSLGTDAVYSDVLIAVLEAEIAYPADDIFVDDRRHAKMGNGIVVAMGDVVLVSIRRRRDVKE